MKNLISIITIFLLLTACVKEDEYDYSKIMPGKQIIEGDNSIKANGETNYIYNAIARGGSNYEWQIISGPGTITVDSSRKYIAYLKVYSTADTVIKIKLKEITHGGIEGVDTFKSIKVNKFCICDINNFVGVYRASAYYKEDMNKEDYLPVGYSINVSKKNDSTLLIDKVLNSYKIDVILKKDGFERLTIVPFIDNTSYVGETTEITGSGKYDGCKKEIYLNYKIKVNNVEYNWLDTLKHQ